MSEEFIPNSEIYNAPPSSPAPTQPSREPIHITIIGPAIGIDLVVKTLHHLGFAEPRAWSKLQNDLSTGRHHAYPHQMAAVLGGYSLTCRP
ncbi:hypothetical protein PGN35_001030 [Nodosilinea sp. PGN35]|uniref:hypothetical protein n=1 Tax=Nodosilinea sp. PGN35 TaxID=3020489 RepID=UPI0023B2B01A|nr:hypothetical protein [Nodosilinea sp. TSF1-S3]MDF0369008.1 hypothetical protein [Nodosilinea sp. TSF1-S3]